ncbi:MAG: hypothetical protein RMX96_02915 [Nostoc sp. ChiSLP02]|nr:hypothetical protein [Nostoc sp. DedSLP05]MDZ8097715.1 hypothetical protein [Nostoc sp. DedSLP01]MDZ8183800.1 hypothetical protein [Nostoc sp. ChiSLP02]
MATKEEVKRYLAYWFQLGKKVISKNGEVSFLPKSVLEGDRYSKEFEESWAKILSVESADCYLEGTHETIADLLTLTWDILPCSRCKMPLAAKDLGMPALVCPCHDLLTWPNTELPTPRSPIETQEQLQMIRDRLLNNSR